MFNDLVNTQIELMHLFQQNNNVVGECIANTKYLLDCIKPFKSNVCAESVVVIGHDPNDAKNEYVAISGHVVLRVDDDIFEPSYEIARLENKQYFGSYQRYKEYVRERGMNEGDTDDPADYLQFIGIAEKLNTDTYAFNDSYYEYYDAQADFVDEWMSKLNTPETQQEADDQADQEADDQADHSQEADQEADHNQEADDQADDQNNT